MTNENTIENTNENTNENTEVSQQALGDILMLAGLGRGFYLKDLGDNNILLDPSLEGTLSDDVRKSLHDKMLEIFKIMPDVPESVVSAFKLHPTWQQIGVELGAELGDEPNNNYIDSIVKYDAVLTVVLLDFITLISQVTNMDIFETIQGLGHKLEDMSTFLSVSATVQDVLKNVDTQETVGGDFRGDFRGDDDAN